MMKRFCCAVVACATVASAMAVSDDVKYASTEMNRAPVSVADGVGGDICVMFLGNSITLHGSCPEIGWTNVWGMAASAAEKDYVHLVAAGIESRTGRKVSTVVRNLAEFERNYRTWDVEAETGKLVAMKPDYLVIALGENVPELKGDADRDDYRAAFRRLISPFLADASARPRTVVRGVFWPNATKDAEMKRVADELGVAFARVDFRSEETIAGTNRFSHVGVANHPGDVGMRRIADEILKAL